MSPLPCWLAGAHSVALNMSNNDLPLQLHFALFDRFGGYLLKPSEMREEMRDLCHPPLSTRLSTRPSVRLSSTQPLSSDTNAHVDAAEDPQSPGAAPALPDSQDGDAYWPPPREIVDVTVMDILSLHNLPKVRLQPVDDPVISQAQLTFIDAPFGSGVSNARGMTALAVYATSSPRNSPAISCPPMGRMSARLPFKLRCIR